MLSRIPNLAGDEIDIFGLGPDGVQDRSVVGRKVVAKHGLEQRVALLKIGIVFWRQYRISYWFGSSIMPLRQKL